MDIKLEQITQQSRETVELQRSTLEAFAKKHRLSRGTREDLFTYLDGSQYAMSFARLGKEQYDSRIHMDGCLTFWNVYSQNWDSSPCWGSGEAMAEEYAQKMLAADLLRYSSPAMTQEEREKFSYPDEWFLKAGLDY